MYQIALQSIQVRKIFPGGGDAPPRKLWAAPFNFKCRGKIYVGGN